MQTTVLLREKSRHETQTMVKEKERFAKKRERKKVILCRLCDNPVTHHSAGISVNRKNRHTFSNPNGFIFEIRCFSQAPGCTNEGIPTTEFSWFPGFKWCYSLCSRCLAHLGWFFSSGTSEFFGLIIDRLKETNNDMD